MAKTFWHKKLDVFVELLYTDSPEPDMRYVKTLDGSKPFRKEYDSEIAGWLSHDKGYVDLCDLEEV